MNNEYGHDKIAIYGLGTETERFISEHGDELDIVCLLDGYRTDGEMYGYSIMPIDAAIDAGIKHIIVIARPGSCKAIARRIRNICIQNDVTLFDVRGNDLLTENRAKFDYKEITAAGENALLQAIDKAEVISFDLFDTLIMRKYLSYTDVFEVVERRLVREGIKASGFAEKRLYAEKELSKKRAPKLEEIYELALGDNYADLEWQIDSSSFMVRNKMLEIMQKAISCGKDVYITTDCYYGKSLLADKLTSLGITGYKDVLVSCEYGVAKNQGLYNILKERVGNRNILHIGDDEYSDIEMAQASGIDTFKILSARDYLELMGNLGMKDCMDCLSERIKLGLVAGRLFSNPFVFEKNESKLAVESARDVGYVFCGSMITDFTLWMRDRVRESGIRQVLLCARDGYILKRLYDYLGEGPGYQYFLTSRTSAIRAGITNDDDIAYVDSMKFFGTKEEELLARYGIEVGKDKGKSQVDSLETGAELNSEDMRKLIMERATKLRCNYQKYIKSCGIDASERLALFDFVAKGTTQYFLKNILSEDIQGFYFLQLEPEFMADKGIRVTPFYSEEERNNSKIFDSYYIMETILTAPSPSVLEFDDDGRPVYAAETRSTTDIDCVLEAQDGIESFFRDYLDLLCDRYELHEPGKALDESLLGLICHTHIADERFTSLIVEDPFFGRMTDIGDVLGG